MDGKLNSPEAQLARMKAEPKQHIQVFVRVRPINTRERAKNALTVLDCPGSREVVVKERSSVNISKTFTFDKVFGPNSKQIDVYKSVVAPLLEEVLLGYNCTVFAYGQTSTGKTFTMEGGERTEGSEVSWENDPLAGIIPRALSQLFDELRLQNAEFTVRVSLLELYNEELFDLLSPTENSKLKTLRLFEDSSRKGSVIIQGLEEVTVHNKSEVYRILEQGTKGRHTAATQMNANSSRSHTIFTVTVHIKESNVEGEELVKIGKLNLVDLAGSENIGRSGAILKHAKEAGSINQSLLTLGRVITALVEHTPHVPYRESKLTRLLQDSLGGRTKTSIIATVSPASINLEETLSTLDYAHRAKDITNRPEINQKMTKRAVLKEYTEEIERLRRDLVASREKTGIYLNRENYDFMMSQIEAQSQEINEKVMLVRSMEEKIEAKEASIAILEEKLEEAKDDLQACHTVLEETTESLEAMKHELKATQSDRDQKSHIVRQQQKTEKELTAQAQKLLVTTEDATSNLDKLYRKLDRKKVVEQKNLDAGGRFKEDVTDGLSSVSDAIQVFRKDHSVFCSKQRIIFESYLREKELKFAGVRKTLSMFSNFISKLETKEHVHSMLEENKIWNKENVQHLEDANGLNTTASAQTQNKILSQFKQLASKINEITSQFEKMLKDYDDKTKHQFNIANSFVDAKMETIRAFQQQYEGRYNEIKLKGEQLQSSLLKQDELLKSNATTFNLQLDALRKVQESFQNEMNSTTAKLIGSVTDSMNGARDLMELVTSNNETAVSKSEALGTVLAYGVQQVEENLHKSELELQSSHETAAETIKGIETDVNEHFQVQANNILEIGKWANTRFNDHEQTMLTFVSKFDQIEDQLQLHSSREIENLEVKLDEIQLAENTLLEEARTALGDHCAEVSLWGDQTAEDTRKQSGKVREFWESTYLIDGPTGATPQRKAYEYPRLLSATSPHEKIVSRYLAERFSENAKTINDENYNPGKKDEVF